MTYKFAKTKFSDIHKLLALLPLSSYLPLSKPVAWLESIEIATEAAWTKLLGWMISTQENGSARMK